MDFWATGDKATGRSPVWGLVGVAVALCAAPWAVLAVGLEMYSTAAWFATWTALGLLAIGLRKPHAAAAGILFALTAPLFAQVPLDEFEGAVRTIIDRGEDKHLGAFQAGSMAALHEVASVALRGLGMDVAADVLAQRTLPGPATRALATDLPMCDPVIRAEAHSMWSAAAGNEADFKPKPISWPRWNEPGRSVAVAAAFDCGATLSGHFGGGRLDLELRCAAQPPRRTSIYARTGTTTHTWDPDVITTLVTHGDLYAFAPVATWTVTADPPRTDDTCETPGTWVYRAVDHWARGD